MMKYIMAIMVLLLLLSSCGQLPEYSITPLEYDESITYSHSALLYISNDIKETVRIIGTEYKANYNPSIQLLNLKDEDVTISVKWSYKDNNLDYFDNVRTDIISINKNQAINLTYSKDGFEEITGLIWYVEIMK